MGALILAGITTLSTEIVSMCNLREVGALPEDSSRGVGAVEVPEKRGAGRRYLGRLVLGAPWGRPDFFSYPNTLSSSGRSGDHSWRVLICVVPLI